MDEPLIYSITVVVVAITALDCRYSRNFQISNFFRFGFLKFSSYVVSFFVFVLFEDFFSTEFRMIKLLFLSVSCFKRDYYKWFTSNKIKKVAL